VKLIKTIFKIVLSLAALYLVWKKIDLDKTQDIFSSINYGYLLLGFVAYTASRLVGAIRLNLFFSQIGLKLGQVFNLKLYYLGMYYNLFLPGGIGGDGYKIYFLKKHYGIKVTELLKSTLMDRITGLFALVFLLLVILGDSGFAGQIDINWGFYILSAALVLPISYGFVRLISSKYLPIFKTSSAWALLLQLTQVISALFILFSLGEFDNISTYLSVFLISSIVAVLPLSIGGIGARELTFVYALEFVNQDYNIGVALSIMFFLFTAISSLWGALYTNIKPENV